MEDEMSEAKRDDLLKRVRNLQEKTTEAGCTEAEALAAAELAARLIDKYGFSQSELEAKAEPVTEDTYITKDRTMRGVIHTLHALQDYCDCKAVLSTRYIEGKRKNIIHVIGKIPDVAMMHYLMNLLAAAFVFEWNKFAKSRSKEERQSSKVKRAFDIGMGTRVGKRLADMKAARNAYIDPDSGRTGQALVVVKNAMVTEKMNQMFPKLKSKTQKGLSGDDLDAFGAGFAAGANVTLNTGIDTNKTQRLQ
jgi:hypothetical protein